SGKDPVVYTVTFSGIEKATVAMLTQGDFHAFVSMGREMIVAFFAAGALWAAVMTPLVYFGVKMMIVRYRTYRNRRFRQRRVSAGDR
ncbi:MAG: hypothetical protein MJ016_06605, partial [Victivallaceae bacterium]|nr:hypothetical protein [Victivallaceae bacterium]